MRIQHNITAMNAYRNYTNNTSALSKNLERLSSGYKINRAGDDAAGLAISEKMRAQISGLEQAQSNAKSGINLVQTAEGALTEVHDMLNRMVTLAEQSANGTYDDDVDRVQLQKEVDQLRSEINRIADSSNFNGINLLDGSLESGNSVTNYSEALKIADWVGSTANATATVGDGTIVHSDGYGAKSTSFSVELNNSSVTGNNGVSITIGSGDNAVKLSLDASEISEGASAEDIASAVAKKYGKDGVNFKSVTGEDVKFNVTAADDRIVFTQAATPTKASEIVESTLAVTYEGIGAVSESNAEAALNTTELQCVADTTNACDADPVSFTWSDSATAEQRNALNNLVESNTTATQSVSVDVTGTADGDKKMTSYKIDVTSLAKALGDDYTITAKVVDGSTGSYAVDADETDANVFNVTNTATLAQVGLTIVDKDGNEIGTLNIGLNNKDTEADGATASTTNTSTITLSQGYSLNTNPTVTLTDGGGMVADTAEKANPLTKGVVTMATGVTDEQLSALNEVLGTDGASVSFQLSGLANNAIDATNGSGLTITIAESLTEAGYKLVDASGNSVTSGEEITLNSAAVTMYTLKDKEGKEILTFNLDLSSNSKLTSDATVVTLNRSAFSADTAEANKVLTEKTAITVTDEDGKEINVSNWGDTTANSADDILEAGTTMSIDIDGQTYSVTVKESGLTEDEQNSGLYISANDTDSTPSAVLAAFQAALTQQLTNAANEGALGTEDYTSYGSITLAPAADTKYVSVTASNVQNFTYSLGGGAESADDVSATGGKDPNANTVNNTSGRVADAGRLASTYFTEDMFSGLKDGSVLKVGDTTYTFAVGKDSEYTGENVVDLTDMAETDSDLVQMALTRLTEMGTADKMFSIGYDDHKLTFTENKEYEWGEGVDLSTADGIAAEFGFSTDGVTEGKSLTLQIGDTAESFNQLSVDVKDMHADAMGIGDIDISTQDGATAAIDKIKDAINYVSDVRGTLGATQNRLDHTINNLSVMQENIQDAESTIRDVDVAEEMMEYTKNNILVQSAQAMLAQANQLPQGVLQLLQ